MSKGNVYWDGNAHITYKGVELDVDVSASGSYYYSPGSMYRSNGDPGDPPEEETEIDTIDIEGIWLDEPKYQSGLNQKFLRISRCCVRRLSKTASLRWKLVNRTTTIMMITNRMTNDG